MRSISDIFDTNKSVIPQVGDPFLIGGEILDIRKNNFTIGRTSMIGGVKINSENLEELLLVCNHIGTKEVNIPSLLIIDGDGALDFNKIDIIPKRFVDIKNPTNNKKCTIKNWIISTETITISSFEKLVFENCKITCDRLEIDDSTGKMPELIKSNIKVKEALIIKSTSTSENSKFTNLKRKLHQNNCPQYVYNRIIDDLGINQINCREVKFEDSDPGIITFVKPGDLWYYAES